jgi:hypothetical protein
MLFLVMNFVYPQKGKEENEKREDAKYELKHKNQAWFKGMKSGANYFQIKQ